MKEETIEIYNSKNQKIASLLARPDTKNYPIVIIIHGFKGTKEYYPFANHSVEAFLGAGIAVLRIDCRGSGESDLEFRETTLKSEAEDVITAIDYVRNLDGVDAKRIGLIGISLGAAAILTAMEQNPPVKNLIFWGASFFGNDYFNTPQNRKTIEEEGVFYVTQKFTGKNLVAGRELFEEMLVLDTKPFMKLIKIPALIIRGAKDNIVDIKRDKEAEELLKAEYHLIKNGDHNFTDKQSEMELINITINWCNKYLK